MQTQRKYKGALPCQDIRKLIKKGYITGVDPLSSNVQPASLDLTITDEAYRLDGSILPARNEHIRSLIKTFRAQKFSLDEPLEINTPYLIRLANEFHLSDAIYGYVNPKSSTGRVDLHTRLIADERESFDSVCTGYRGGAWVLVIPKSFRTKLAPGMSLNQMRFFTEDTRLTQAELEHENARHDLVWDTEIGYPIRLEKVVAPNRNGSVVLQADLRSETVGWFARKTDEVLDLSLRDIDPSIFWEKACPKNGRLLLMRNLFWILSTLPGIVVPPWLSAEVVAMDERFMEGRTHYAGFFDPGWGWRPGMPMGDRATMEVRTHEDMYLREDQPFVAFKYEYMTDIPDTLYGAGSNYAGQNCAGLAKFFAKAA